MKAAIRWAYAIVVLNAVLPLGLANAGWVAMATGGMGYGVPLLGPLVFLVLGLYRVYLVARVPGTLDAPASEGRSLLLRRFGVVLLFVGAAVGAINLMSRPIASMVGPRAFGDAPVFFVAGIYLSILGGIGVIGLVLFEFTRLRAFEGHKPGAVVSRDA